MILMITVIGYSISTVIWLGLDDIKIELRYRNTLLEEQVELLRRQNDIMRTKK